MDLREVGHLFLIGFQGTKLTPELREFLDELNPSGVVLFARNIEDPVQVAKLNHDLQFYASKTLGQGLFIAVDQEGGRVRRLREPFTPFPPAMELALSANPDEAVRQFGLVTAREIRLAGFNLDFVPVLDVPADPDHPLDSVIGDRAYGYESDLIARLGRIVIETMRSRGVIPCCKHFPGHGGTVLDSHADLPVDGRDFLSLEQSDLVPFLEAARMNVEMTMTAHVLYPLIDPDFPATLSRSVVDGMLRQRMEYDGVVITDDMDMAAVSERYSPQECCFRAFSAGADLLLFCNDPSKAFSGRAKLFEAFKSGEIPAQRLHESLRRIRQLKARFAASMTPCHEQSLRDYFKSRNA